MDVLRTVIALDVGTRNLGVAVVDNRNWRAPKRWVKVDILGKNKKPSVDVIVKCTVKWVRDHAYWFESADAVVLENQLRTPFIVMNAVISALHLEKVVVVHPLKVGRFWNLPTTRAAKKKAAVACVAQNGAVFPAVASGKYDDLADAWLMAVWMLIELGGLRVDAVSQFLPEFE